MSSPLTHKSTLGYTNPPKKRVLITEAKDDKGLGVILCADEWCNTLGDIQAFAESGAADMIQVKPPDLGGVQNTVDAILLCKAKGVKAYLGGSSCETVVSRRAMAQVALATEAELLLAASGMGIDEGYTFAHNEMVRTLAVVAEHHKKSSVYDNFQEVTQWCDFKKKRWYRTIG